MFARFTDRARRVVVLAQEEARILSHDRIGTEHILLGLIHEAEGVAPKTLQSLGISLENVRRQAEEIVGEGKSRVTRRHIPFTPRAKKVLELSLREALQLGHNYIGTEHILLGLIREGEGVAAHVLVSLGADLNKVRHQIVQILSGSIRGEESVPTPEAPFDLRDLDEEIAEEAEPFALTWEERGTGEARRRVDNPPGCPSCRAPLAESAAFRVLDVPQEGGGTTRKVLFVFCGSCGVTIDDEILPEGS